MNDIETKLAAARTKLILDKPFLGALVLRLPMKAAAPKWCPTTATDAKHFFYSEDYIHALSLDQVQFVLAHEALHCALSHFARRQHRVKFRWDLACDYAINPLLLVEGLTPPPDVNIMPDFKDMTAEEIYPMLDENNSDEPMDKHVYDEPDKNDNSNQQSQRDKNENEPEQGDVGDADNQPPEAELDKNKGGAKQPPPLSQDEQENLSVQWQQRLAGAAQQAQQAGKMGAAMARLVDHLLQPQRPWRSLLAHYMTLNARDDYSYMRPSRREGDAILPSLRSHQLEIAVALDSSGSITDKEIQACLSEVDGIKGQIRARVTLLACDAEIDEDAPWVYEPWDTFSPPKQFNGGGGTRFTPVFEWLQGADKQPDLLVYFTDAEGEFPAQPPDFPVLWLVKGKRKVPWGQRIQLN
ncbi:vWA domain-containing protein [Candidatus Venteria ishoeyi]|uniref:VWA-like domain-containing protein n=1 Tax=Candidatus Venteria ishoeyi TaxID=1899563 RepID=A0A1H6FEG0_9GAMM|nr:VWA-like domain-containing protein [Candidatus Venteria ishoeyi]MDM8547068.1 VWA-like domain-containing protein [Candidatus Venteria ishoeyi]SEH07719.1 Uncharacterised protein [Candidatus Venteria ishoeyi]